LAAGSRRSEQTGGNKVVRFAFVENAGPDNVRDVLPEKLRDARDAHNAATFVTSSGLGQILRPLCDVAAQGRVRILTGGWIC